MRPSLSLLLLLGLVAALVAPLASWGAAPAPRSGAEIPDTLVFTPLPPDTLISSEEHHRKHRDEEEEEWMSARIGDQLITDRDQWRARGHHTGTWNGYADYNRVDRLRFGAGYELQVKDPMAPRLGGRLEYADGRDQLLYGFQIEQPIVPPGRISIGASLVRRTDHHELQQVSDFENTVALLLARHDYRDYWEREGEGVYLAWRVPDFSTVSLHMRRDEYRTLVSHGATSWLNRDAELRPNPPIEDGTANTLSLRLEKGARTTIHTHAGTYHWLEAEWAGGSLGGDFTYTRLLGDLRGVLRLSPATTLMLRGVVGTTTSGRLPAQLAFPLGGPDGLRAHDVAQYHGEQLALMEAEYIIGLWKLRTGAFEGGLHAIVFVDAGAAWNDPEHDWSIGDRKIEMDGGFGLAAAEDKLRVYFARDLHRTDAPFVVSVRLQRPF
jgi:hypothetical protein